MDAVLVKEVRRPFTALEVNTSATLAVKSTTREHHAHRTHRGPADVSRTPSSQAAQRSIVEDARVRSRATTAVSPSPARPREDVSHTEEETHASPQGRGMPAVHAATAASTTHEVPRSNPADTGHAVSVHPPTATKPQVPSRRSSMARLLSQQGGRPSTEAERWSEKEAALLNPAVAAPAAAGVVVAETPDQSHMDNGTPLREAVHIFSYRPRLASPAPAGPSSSSPSSSSSSSITSLNRKHHIHRQCSSWDATQASPPGVAVGTAKVLPRGLRSPSTGTDAGGSPGREDDGDVRSSITATSSTAEDHRRYSVSHGHASSPVTYLPSTAAAATTVASEVVRLSPRDGVNAPFHALQLVALSNHDAFLSPPHSGRSEGVEDNSTAAAHTGTTSTTTTAAAATAAARRERVGVPCCPPDGNCEDASEMVICPFALLGCCRRGMHTAAELRNGSVLHGHLTAVAGRVHRMKARQQLLEQSVVVMRSQMRTQAEMIRHITAQLAELHEVHQGRKGSHHGRSTPGGVDYYGSGSTRTEEKQKGSLPSTLAEVSLSGNTLSSLDAQEHDEEGDVGRHRRTAAATSGAPRNSNSGGGGSTRKALPGNFSVGEPQMTDYGVGDYDDVDDDDDGDDTATYEDALHERADMDEGTYARRLRSRTESAKHLYALREGSANPTRIVAGHDGARRATLPFSHSDKDGAAAAAVTTVRMVNPDCSRAASTQPRPAAKISEQRRHGPGNEDGADLPCTLHSLKGQRADGRRPRHARGGHRSACISTEVSGMSNVPPYQLPNESVSTISSASSGDADYDDADVGEIRQRLLNLSAAGGGSHTPEAVVSPLRQRVVVVAHTPQLELQKRHCHSVREAPPPSQRMDRVAEEGSARSTPSLVSTTYRPSQLAQACPTMPTNRPNAAPSAGGGRETSEQRRRNHQHSVGPAADPPLAGDVVRPALPLRRPALIRQTDITHDRSTAAATATTTTSNAALMILPRPVPARVASPTARRLTSPLLLTSGQRDGVVSAHSPMMHAMGIMNKTSELKPRRLTALDSDGKRVIAVDFAAVRPSEGREEGAGGDVGDGGTVKALRAAAAGADVADARGVHEDAAHAHSYHYAEDCDGEGHVASRSAVARPRKKSSARNAEKARRSSRRCSRSPAEREAAGRQREHATSLLSMKEAAGLQEGMPLGLPPRRMEEL